MKCVLLKEGEFKKPFRICRLRPEKSMVEMVGSNGGSTKIISRRTRGLMLKSIKMLTTFNPLKEIRLLIINKRLIRKQCNVSITRNGATWPRIVGIQREKCL